MEVLFMKKKLLLTCALTLGVTILPFTSFSMDTVSASSYTNKPSSKEQYVTLGSYYIDAKTTKQLAKNLKMITKRTKLENALRDIFSKTKLSKNPYVKVTLLASDLSRDAQKNKVIAHAAKNNMRLKVTIQDTKGYSTSYSKRIVWEAVK
jgi:hypothetical protein